MKVICACLNARYIHSALAPWCLKAGVEAFCDDNVTVKVMESTINADINDFADRIIDEKPDILALSCYIWNINMTLFLAEKISNEYSCKIVLGGPEVSFCAEDILRKYRYIDYISCGEGEWSVSAFVNAINNNSDLSSAEGLVFRDETDNVIINPVIYHDEIPPSPYCDDYFNSLNGRIAYIESSRGCPYSCSYCLSGNIGKLKLFNIQQVKEEIRLLAASTAITVKFIDRTFNASAEHANEILKYIYDNFANSGICFHFEIAGDILKEDTINILRNMPQGLVQLEIGIQSFNEKTLSYINRKTNLKKLSENLNKLQKNGNIHIHTDLIAGLPFEDLSSFKTSFNNAYHLRPDMLQLGILKLLHGSEMKNNSKKYPAIHSSIPPYEIICNPWVSEDDIFDIKNCEKALDKLYNSGRFLLTIEFLLNALNCNPFELFSNFGKNNDLDGISLTELSEKIFTYFSDLCDSVVLKEKICCDLISVKSNIKLPSVLSSYDVNYKKYKKYFSEKFRCNVKIVLLNSCNKIYVVPQNLSMDTKGRYHGLSFSIDDIKEKV